MPTRLTTAVCLVFGLAACGHKVGGPVSVTATSLYNIDTVRVAVIPSGIQDKGLAAAIALYRNKKSYQEAADSLKNVIYRTPTARAYYELGTALLLGKSYAESIQALRIAEQLQYAPLSKVLYELAAAYVNCPGSVTEQLDNQRKAIRLMQVAIQMGYPDPDQFNEDPAFATIRPDYLFKEGFREALSGRKDMTASLWTDFLKGFKPLPLPYAIDTNWVHAHGSVVKAGDIDFIYEKFITEIRNARFARGDEPGYFSIGLVRQDSNFVALLYGGSEDWGDEDDSDPTDSTQDAYRGPVFFYLTTYGAQGKIIDKLLVAGQDLASQPYKTFAMSPSLEFAVSGLAQPGDTTLSTQHYRINSLGRFEKVDAVPLAAR
jgi:tetratricopeptide (TPR) repeat protein